MTTQLSLLDPPVSQVRRSDPRTARVAAARNPGGRASQAARILRFVWDHGTITADQAHRLNGPDEDTPRGEWSTRLGVLCTKERGLLERAGEIEEADRHGRVRKVLRYRLTDRGHAECARMWGGVK
jgi:hypothetical protein